MGFTTKLNVLGSLVITTAASAGFALLIAANITRMPAQKRDRGSLPLASIIGVLLENAYGLMLLAVFGEVVNPEFPVILAARGKPEA